MGGEQRLQKMKILENMRNPRNKINIAGWQYLTSIACGPKYYKAILNKGFPGRKTVKSPTLAVLFIGTSVPQFYGYK